MIKQPTIININLNAYSKCDKNLKDNKNIENMRKNNVNKDDINCEDLITFIKLNM